MLRLALRQPHPRAGVSIPSSLCKSPLRVSVYHGHILRPDFELRHFSSTRIRAGEPSATSIPHTNSSGTLKTTTSAPTKDEEYVGPLTATFKRLKTFSLASFGLSLATTPFIFVIDSSLPTFARTALAFTAISTSGVSTALVAWVARPYVSSLKRLESANTGGVQGIEMTTSTIFLNQRTTRVYDPDFLVETQRPFAKWQLAKQVALPTPHDGSALPAAGTEETIAETFDKDGTLMGRWIVKWGENGEGDCTGEGYVDRYFNVHLELLQ